MSFPLLTFACPAWLLALLPLAFFAWRYWRTRWSATPWQQVVDAHLLPHLLATDQAHTRLSRILPAIAWLCAVIALAGPRLEGAVEQQATHRNALHVLVVDLSPDAAPRLERVKARLHTLVRALHGAELALLVYAEEPYLVVPPTSDADVVARFIPELSTDAMPTAGNRPERAMRMAAEVLRRSNADARSIVWAGSASPPAEAPSGIALFALHDGDDMALQQLVETLTTGKWMTAARKSSGSVDIGYWFLLPLLPLAALRFRRGLLAVLPLLLCAGMVTPPAEAARLADLDAKQLFDKGKHDAAAARFTDPRWQALAHYRAGRFAEASRLLEGRDDPDSLYNRGNALARMGLLQEALGAYEASLRVRPGDADTVYNRDLMQRLLNANRNRGNSGNSDGSHGAQSERDAARIAEQWLRNVPDEPATLLRRKLQIEHQRRASGEARRPW